MSASDNKFSKLFKFLLLPIFVIVACKSNFITLSNGAIRPKTLKFESIKFNSDSLTNSVLDNEFVYIKKREGIWSKNFFSGHKNKDSLYDFFGFYSDGGLIKGTIFKQDLENKNFQNNSFETALNIGYYGIKSDTIIIKYFAATSDGGVGNYFSRKLLIKPDTLILFNKWSNGDLKPETFVLSELQMK